MHQLPNLALTRANPDELRHRDRVPLLQPSKVVLPQLRHRGPLASANTSTRVPRRAQRLVPQLPRQAEPEHHRLRSSEPCCKPAGARLGPAAGSAEAEAMEVKASGRYTQRG
jgi:hypothetical protein